MSRQSIASVAAILGILSLAACSKSQPPAPASGSAGDTVAATQAPAAAANAAVDDAQAKEMFKARCAPCHGEQGRGDGPASAALNPKPRNYHDKTWQSKVTDDDIKKTITYGGAAVGKSPIMPSSPDLESKPEVIDGLVHLVRAFGKS